MSSEESDGGYRHKRKRKIRRLSDSSPASTSSGSPVILNKMYKKGRSSALREEHSDSEDPVVSNILKKKRVSRISESSLSDNDLSPVIQTRPGVSRPVLSSGSDSSSGTDLDDIILRRNRATAPLSVTDSESDESDQWEAYDTDSDNEVTKSTNLSDDTKKEEKEIDSDSSDGQSDKCPICLISFRLQEVGIPENCDHAFCLECIQEWSKNMNTCPVDRKEYNSISVKKSVEGTIVRQIPIEKPQLENEVDIFEDPTFCEICGSNDHEDRLLLCDGCDLGFHLYCLTPPLDEVPEGSWYCNECDPSVNVNIEAEEVAGLYEDAEEHFGRHIISGHRRHASTRLVPRTRQSERVRRRIQTNRSQRQLEFQEVVDEAPSTSNRSSQVESRSVSSTTGPQRRKKKNKKRKRKSGKYRIVYELDRVTGEAVPVKKWVRNRRRKRKKRNQALSPADLLKKSIKQRLALQLSICQPRNVPQMLPDVKILPGGLDSIRNVRYSVGIPNVDLFGTRGSVDEYIPQSDDDENLYGDTAEGNLLLARRTPNTADVLAVRRMVRRKTAVLNVPTVSSSTDILGSIMDSQEKLLSKDSVMSVDSSGKLKIETKKDKILNNNNNNLTKPNLNSYSVRQKPYGNRNSTGSGYSTNQSWSNSRMYNSVGSQEPYYNTSNSNYNQSNDTPGVIRNSSGEQVNDVPQDYTQRTLCEAQLLQEAEEKDKCTPGSSTPISESDLDIYSDIENETVTTSKVEDDFRPPSPPSPPAQLQSNTPNTDEDNDSESGMVIDTEKTSDEMKEPVTSTVENNPGQLYSPENVTYSPGQPTESPTHSTYSPEQPTSDEPAEISTNVTEEESEAVQSSSKHNKPHSDKLDDDDDSNDGCPNFSIYSRASKTVALTTDITLPAPNTSQENTSVENSDSAALKTDNLDLNNENDKASEQSNNAPCIDNTDSQKSPIKEKLREKEKSNTSWNMGVLYSDSEDETVVKKTNNSFAISDIKDITEDILSEEERSYTPLLDEKGDKPKEGLEGLDTEMISDEDRNDFDEAQELKTVSDGDALEINAKESELDFTRPEEFEEGEIVDKNKEKNTAEQAVPAEQNSDKCSNEEKDKTEKKEEKDTKKKKKVKSKEKQHSVTVDKNGNKENQSKPSSFKKLSRTNKERNYRDKDKNKNKSKDNDRNRSRSKTPEKSEKEARKRKEKRREIERYNVRAIIADKPRPPPKDQFGRDLRRTLSRSRSRSKSASYTPPIVYRSRSLSIIRGRRSLSKRKSKSLSRARTHSRGRRSVSKRRSPSKSKDKNSKRRGRSRNRRSGSRSRSRSDRRRRDRSKYKKRKRSTSKGGKRKKSKERYRTKSKKRARASKSNSKLRSCSPSVSPKRKKREWTPSFSRSPSPQMYHMSPSWTPPRIDNSQTLRNQNLTVILNNDAAKKRKKDKRNKEKKDQSKKRRRERDRTPPPSKEVFASGDNILVSVSFNNENETRDVTTRDRRRKEVLEEQKKKKDRRNRNKRDISGIKPVAIIDLERSPFQEITASPKDVIILSDSDNNENENRNMQNLCDSSQQVASPERSPSYGMGPKTPPEPTVKFSLVAKPPQLRAISNPLHEPDLNIDEDIQADGNNTMHKGPNTPPEEPPTSPPSSPDAYDPFEPTKSRSPTPDPIQTQNVNGADPSLSEVLENQPDIDNILEKAVQSCDVTKSLTPPIADIQPADSQSSIQEISDSKSPDQPQRIGVVINQSIQPPNSKPVAQTTPFSSVPTSITTTTTNVTISRINYLNSTVITLQPQRIVLPNQVKSSPVKISPTKATVKSTPIKPIQKINKLSKKSRPQNGGSIEEVNLDFDSPYSPGSSDYEDLFEPPIESIITAKQKPKSKTNNAPKHQSMFDTLFGGSPTYDKKKGGKRGSNKKNLSKTKQVGVKIDEDSLKILEELPNSAVEMQVKDKFLKKLNRQERVVEEVKLVLKPYYNKKKITKEEYKDIMRRAVPKICHNKSGEINPIKIRTLIEAYVKKVKHSKKVTSSSSLPQKVV